MRLAVARQQGLDETTIADADQGGEQLTAGQRAAVALAQSMMSDPGHLDPVLGDELHRHFDRRQLVELTLDVMKWNYQKIPVALGTDVEVRPGELTDLEFDADGHWIRPDR